jgi:dTDP-4-amino-4,6-dideoxygalactose transaminase
MLAERVEALADSTVVPITDLAAMTRDVAPALDAAWRETTESSSFIGGEAVERFEEKWARFCGSGNSVGVANGTDAIELTLRGLGIGPGDDVIVPANTFIATVEGVVLAGARPRFADVDPHTLLLSPATIQPAITPRTAAVVVVELYGNMPAMDSILQLASAKGLAVIEDAAQAHGSMWRGRKAGSFGVAGCFSFYPGKNLGAFGDAGAVVTNDAALASRVRSLGNHGRPADTNHVHSIVGRNSRLDGLQAAILSIKLDRLDHWNSARRAAISRYRQLLRPDLVRMVRGDEEGKSTFHQNVVRVPHRDAVRTALAGCGIESGIHYPVPCHQQEPYMPYSSGHLPTVERAAREIVSLPLFPHMTDGQVDYVSTSLNDIMGRLDVRHR